MVNNASPFRLQVIAEGLIIKAFPDSPSRWRDTGLCNGCTSTLPRTVWNSNDKAKIAKHKGRIVVRLYFCLSSC